MTEQPTERRPPSGRLLMRSTSAPDGSFTITGANIYTAAQLIKSNYGDFWRGASEDERIEVVAGCLSCAMGYAPLQTFFLMQNPYFVTAVKVLVDKYEQFRQEGRI